MPTVAMSGKSRRGVGRLAAALFLGMAFCAAAARPAHAQDPDAQVNIPAPNPNPSDEDITLAKAHYTSGTAYYDQGLFDQAVTEFLEAYKLSGKADILYNIGVCYDHLRQDALAEAYYKAYLKAKPDAPDRETVQETIDAIDKQRAQMAAAGHPGTGGQAVGPAGTAGGTSGEGGTQSSASPPSGPPAPTGPTFLSRHRNSVIAGSVTGACLITTIITGVISMNANSELHSGPHMNPQSLIDESNTYGATAIVFGVLTAAGAATTGYLYYRETQHPASTVAVIAPTPGGAAFTIAGTF